MPLRVASATPYCDGLTDTLLMNHSSTTNVWSIISMWTWLVGNQGKLATTNRGRPSVNIHCSFGLVDTEEHIMLGRFSPDTVFHPLCFSKRAPGSPDRREMTNQLAAAAATHRCLQQTANSLVWTSSLWRSASAITSASHDFTWNIIRAAL